MRAFFKRRKSREAKKQGEEDKDRPIEKKRLFYINDRERNSMLPPTEPNYIRTTKYTMWSFLPLSLMFQFKRLPNFYFLIQAILNSISIVSAMNPVSAYLPLCFVLIVSIVREGYEDYQRFRSDKETNQ